MIKFLIGLLAVYIAFTGLLFVMQRKLQYLPDPRLVEPAEVGLDGFKASGSIPPTASASSPGMPREWQPHPTIVYFQGNGLGLEARVERFRLFHRAGYGVLALGYRGYSGSTGTPTEAGPHHRRDDRGGISPRQRTTAERLVYSGSRWAPGWPCSLPAAKTPGPRR
jgi:uncharacterized protein